MWFAKEMRLVCRICCVCETRLTRALSSSLIVFELWTDFSSLWHTSKTLRQYRRLYNTGLAKQPGNPLAEKASAAHTTTCFVISYLIIPRYWAVLRFSWAVCKAALSRPWFFQESLDQVILVVPSNLGLYDSLIISGNEWSWWYWGTKITKLLCIAVKALTDELIFNICWNSVEGEGKDADFSQPLIRTLYCQWSLQPCKDLHIGLTLRHIILLQSTSFVELWLVMWFKSLWKRKKNYIFV